MGHDILKYGQVYYRVPKDAKMWGKEGRQLGVKSSRALIEKFGGILNNK